MTKEEEQFPTPLGWQGRSAHELVMAGFKERTRRRKVTGEWLIYGEHASEKYYLCVANHLTDKENDKKLYALIVSNCDYEYPLLFNKAK